MKSKPCHPVTPGLYGGKKGSPSPLTDRTKRDYFLFLLLLTVHCSVNFPASKVDKFKGRYVKP